MSDPKLVIPSRMHCLWAGQLNRSKEQQNPYKPPQFKLSGFYYSICSCGLGGFLWFVAAIPALLKGRFEGIQGNIFSSVNLLSQNMWKGWGGSPVMQILHQIQHWRSCGMRRDINDSEKPGAGEVPSSKTLHLHFPFFFFKGKKRPKSEMKGRSLVSEIPV